MSGDLKLLGIVGGRLNDIQSGIDEQKTTLTNIDTQVDSLETILSSKAEASVLATLVDTVNSLKTTINEIKASSSGNSGGVQIFKANGTFTVPPNVEKILITACGGGASGDMNGHSGNGAEWIWRVPFSVSPMQKISMTIGKGGYIANRNDQTQKTPYYDAVAGSDTIIEGLITLSGGKLIPRVRNGNGGLGGIRDDIEAEDTLLGKGGLGDGITLRYGGGASLGDGGNAGLITETKGKQSPGTPGTYGAGGGYGGKCNAYTNTAYCRPGDGGDGIVIIEW